MKSIGPCRFVAEFGCRRACGHRDLLLHPARLAIPRGIHVFFYIVVGHVKLSPDRPENQAVEHIEYSWIPGVISLLVTKMRVWVQIAPTRIREAAVRDDEPRSLRAFYRLDIRGCVVHLKRV